MTSRNIKAPILRLAEIRERVELFRQQFEKTQEVPVDILHVAEFDLGLSFVPIKGLKKTVDVSAFLAFDRTQIMVDWDEFMLPKFEKRLRFSVAHEIGHFVLHENVYSHLTLESEEDWIEIQKGIPSREFSFLETHANEFAGRLLVPLDVLVNRLQEARGLLEGSGYDETDPVAIGYMAGVTPIL